MTMTKSPWSAFIRVAGALCLVATAEGGCFYLPQGTDVPLPLPSADAGPEAQTLDATVVSCASCCTSNAECFGSNPVCNPLTEQCVQCVGDSDCPPGDLCLDGACVVEEGPLDAGPVCLNGFALGSDCSTECNAFGGSCESNGCCVVGTPDAGACTVCTCDDGTCAFTGNGDCDNGTNCLTDGGCTTKDDCPFLETCSSGSCVSPASVCSSDSQCGRGTICNFNQVCSPGCDTDQDCVSPGTCDDTSFTCTNSCSSTAPCPGGGADICFTQLAQCVQCLVDSDCPTGEACIMNSCGAQGADAGG